MIKFLTATSHVAPQTFCKRLPYANVQMSFNTPFTKFIN